MVPEAEVDIETELSPRRPVRGYLKLGEGQPVPEQYVLKLPHVGTFGPRRPSLSYQKARDTSAN